MTPGRRPSAGVIAALLIVAGLVIGGIAAVFLQSPSGVGSIPTPSARPSASSSAPSASAPSSSVAASAPGSSAASSSGLSSALRSASASGPQAIVDVGMLAVLPSAVAGVPVRTFPEAAQQAVLDPDLGRNVSRVATAFVGDAGGANWAYTAIVDVRPEARSDAFYRDWQESFDASACERAGGVTGHTTMVIAGRDVERTACGSGVRTYHVRIADGGLLISISDLGNLKFGEQELAALRP